MSENDFKPINDKLLVYLDQNVLSDLRNRVIEKEGNEKYKRLKKILASKHSKLQVVYSESNLIEIDRINESKYRDEHIELLEELNALYIEEPESKEKFRIYVDQNHSPTAIWSNYLERKSLNKDHGLREYLDIIDLQSRKVFGLLKEPTFQELYNRLCNNCDHLFSERDRKDFLDEKIIKNYDDLKISLQKQIGKDDEILLDVDLWREKINKRLPDLLELPVAEVLPQIIKALGLTYFNQPETYYYRHISLNKVVEGYKLLNVIGYHSDDFRKNKRNTDRYAASFGDSYHVSSAIDVHFLISNDQRFRKKAEVCYSYAGIKTRVCSIDEFLKIVNPFNKLAFAIKNILFFPKK